MFIEEGRYKDIETFNIPTSPKSIRLVKDDMGSPELYLASSTNYEGMKSGGHLRVIRGDISKSLGINQGVIIESFGIILGVMKQSFGSLQGVIWGLLEIT